MATTAPNIVLKEKSQQQFIVLKRKVAETVQQLGLDRQKAQVAVALDISGSMADLFYKGIVQQVLERVLALSIKFDDNGAVDVFLFGAHDHAVGELREADFFGYVERVIRAKYPLEGMTRYAGVIRRITEHYFPGGRPNTPDPAYILFITDGDNNDPQEAEQAIIAASNKPIFWQFVGLGNSDFAFLQKLDTMPGRHIDNANFFKIDNIGTMDDAELYRRLLAEFPSWLELAKRHGVLTAPVDK